MKCDKSISFENKYLLCIKVYISLQFIILYQHVYDIVDHKFFVKFLFKTTESMSSKAFDILISQKEFLNL